MIFEWDGGKNASNIEKHGFDFIDVWQLFEGEHIKGGATQGIDGEQRFIATGFVRGVYATVIYVYATVIYTVRDGITQIISLRKARKNERRQHQALHEE